MSQVDAETRQLMDEIFIGKVMRARQLSMGHKCLMVYNCLK